MTVRGGGHNVAGRATIDGGLMIDLSTMKGVQLDVKTRTARAQGGVTWRGSAHPPWILRHAAAGLRPPLMPGVRRQSLPSPNPSRCSMQRSGLQSVFAALDVASAGAGLGAFARVEDRLDADRIGAA
jgi:hypothetical protein